MTVGERGFLTFKGVSYLADGVPVTYEGTQKGAGGTVFHLFRAKAGWVATATEADFATGHAAFGKAPKSFANNGRAAQGGNGKRRKKTKS